MPTRDGRLPDWSPRWSDTGGTAPVRLLCVPHAGGTATSYRDWPARLADLAEVTAVSLPGRGHRRAEPLVEDMHELADGLTAAVAGLDARPLVIFGCSLGGLLGFEVARRLTAAGRPPAALVVAACPPPRQVVRLRPLHAASDDEFVAELRRLGATAEGLLADAEMMQVLLPVLRADYAAVERYRPRPGPRLRTPLLTLAGRADPEAGPATMAGWSAEAVDCRHEVVDGGHLFLDTAAGVVLLHVRSVLAGVAASSRTEVSGDDPELVERRLR
jgi:pyochelin biosynthetic protein PchC